MSIVTAERWIWLPRSTTGGGTADRLPVDGAGGGGTLQLLASNATHAARENGLGTLWEDRGTDDLNLDFENPDDPTTVRWDAEDADGGYNRFAGLHRVRTFGEDAVALPRIELHARAAAPSTFRVVILVAACPVDQPPRLVDGQYAVASTTSTSIVPLVATLDAYPLEWRSHTPRDPATGAIPESGRAPVVALWVAAWCTSGSGGAKGAVYGLSLYLRPPSPRL